MKKNKKSAKDFMCQDMDYRNINTPEEWDELSRDNKNPYRDNDVVQFLGKCLKQVQDENNW